MAIYNHKDIEAKWQKYWEEQKTYLTKESGDKKFYILDMFPYPSGEGLHVGHPKGYIATDVYSRLKTMQGYDVLHPMGFDAFGLPAEQFALKNKVNPNISTEKNVARYKQQLRMLGLNYDWEREINTTDPKFYKWTQWMWKQMYKKNLAYESYDPINWCPSCKTGLSNEDLENGLCERCGSVVEKKPLRQWTIRITDYADRLLADLDKLNWEPHIKELQRNWIGKSEGSEIDFPLVDFPYQESLKVFTTRADTMYGATFMAISYEVAERWIEKGWKPDADVVAMIEEIKIDAKKQDFSFKELPEKKGIATGVTAKNPVNDEVIPVYIANYILSGYGTGAIMAVPAHDERDNEFAKKYNLQVNQVIAPEEDRNYFDEFFIDHESEVIEVVFIIKNKQGNFLLENYKNWKETYLFVKSKLDLSEVDSLHLDSKLFLKEAKQSLGYEEIVCRRSSTVVIQNKSLKVGVVFQKIIYLEFEVDTDKNFSHLQPENCEYLWVKKSELSSYVKHDLYVKYFLENIFSDEGVVVNSADFNNLTSKEARIKITEKVGGKLTSTYKLKDWVFARQRYWGEPFPIVFNENHTSYAVADSELPVTLPMVDEYEPTGTGESPLANIKEWVEVTGFIDKNNEWNTIPAFNSFIFNKNEPLDINDGEGKDKYRSGAPITERNNVACIIKHPTEEKYLVARWRQVNWNGFLTGGIENGQSEEETVRQEVKEETGFTSIKSIKVTDFSSHGLFYHPVKNHNRFAHYKLAIVELADLTRNEVSEEEKAIAWFEWVDKDNVEKLLTRFDMKSLWQYYTLGKVSDKNPINVIQGKRETNTMPQWAGSSWYYLRYIDPNNDAAFVDSEKEKKWSPVDFYVGGAEHATRHLIYARFWHKFFFDMGLVSYDEPFMKLQTVGLIMAEDGRKMSKRWGNIVNPDDVVDEYGADTLRLYEMFMGPFDQAVAWSTKSMAGVNRFLERYYKLHEKVNPSKTMGDALQILLNQTIQKVGGDIEEFKFNTAISSLMILLNALEKEDAISLACYTTLTKLLAPFAPHLAEEMWYTLGNTDSIHQEAWPTYDESKLYTDTVTVAIQVLGKLRGTVEVARDMDEESLKNLIQQREIYKKYVGDAVPKKVIVIKNKIVNYVI